MAVYVPPAVTGLRDVKQGVPVVYAPLQAGFPVPFHAVAMCATCGTKVFFEEKAFRAVASGQWQCPNCVRVCANHHCRCLFFDHPTPVFFYRQYCPTCRYNIDHCAADGCKRFVKPGVPFHENRRRYCMYHFFALTKQCTFTKRCGKPCLVRCFKGTLCPVHVKHASRTAKTGGDSANKHQLLRVPPAVATG